MTTETRFEAFLNRLYDAMMKPIEYGLIGLVILALLWVAQVVQVLPKSFRAFGVEFELPANQEAAIEQSFMRIVSLENEVRDLKKELATVVEAFKNPTTAFDLEPEQIEEIAADIVEDEILTLKETTLKNGTGFVWVGTYSPSDVDPNLGTWTETAIKEIELGSVAPVPSAFNLSEVTTSTGLNLRQYLPDANPETQNYYERTSDGDENPSLGIVEEGSLMTIDGTLTSFTRAGLHQIWAKVITDYTLVED